MASFIVFLSFLMGLLDLVSGSSLRLRNLMYLTGQHPNVPKDSSDTHSITHVALAFMNSGRFNADETPSEWPLFTTVAKTRALFRPDIKVLVAIGGWGDTEGFRQAANATSSRQRFARNIAAMLSFTGADGIDVDWEYPGGNGEDYKQVPNKERLWEIEAYPLLLAEIRSAIGPDKIISAAVPGKPDDMMAFTRETVPHIMQSIDFLNVMAYDLMNRRDNVTKHHSGVSNSLEAVDAYLAAGVKPSQMNLGLAFYVKYFQTEHDDCLRAKQSHKKTFRCRTLLMEDPDTGADLGHTGGFAWHDAVPDDVATSFARAQTLGSYEEGEGWYYWDEKQDIWWTWEAERSIIEWKFPLIIQKRELGGVFAWGLGEDGDAYRHLHSVNKGLKMIDKYRDEL